MTLICPRCAAELRTDGLDDVFVFVCDGCGGTAMTPPVLRRIASDERVRALFLAARDRGTADGDPCPSCTRTLSTLRFPDPDRGAEVSICRGCQLVWFDRACLHRFAGEAIGVQSAPGQARAEASTLPLAAGPELAFLPPPEDLPTSPLAAWRRRRRQLTTGENAPRDETWDTVFDLLNHLGLVPDV